MQNFLKQITNFFKKHHPIFFVVFALGGLATIIFMSYQIILSASDISNQESYTPEVFNQQSMQMLEDFQNNQANQQLDFPANERTDPFVE